MQSSTVVESIIIWSRTWAQCIIYCLYLKWGNGPTHSCTTWLASSFCQLSCAVPLEDSSDALRDPVECACGESGANPALLMSDELSLIVCRLCILYVDLVLSQRLSTHHSSTLMPLVHLFTWREEKALYELIRKATTLICPSNLPLPINQSPCT